MTTNTFGAAAGRALENRAAARHGRWAGREGLSVDEVADTEYLVGLRHRLRNDRVAIAADRARRLDELEASARDAEAVAAVLRASRGRVIAMARESADERLDRYEELCAIYGRHWQRSHCDRSFAHIGWRRPRPPDPHPAEEQ